MGTSRTDHVARRRLRRKLEDRGFNEADIAAEVAALHSRQLDRGGDDADVAAQRAGGRRRYTPSYEPDWPLLEVRAYCSGRREVKRPIPPDSPTWYLDAKIRILALRVGLKTLAEGHVLDDTSMIRVRIRENGVWRVLRYTTMPALRRAS